MSIIRLTLAFDVKYNILEEFGDFAICIMEEFGDFVHAKITHKPFALRGNNCVKWERRRYGCSWSS